MACGGGGEEVDPVPSSMICRFLLSCWAAASPAVTGTGDDDPSEGTL